MDLERGAGALVRRYWTAYAARDLITQRSAAGSLLAFATSFDRDPALRSRVALVLGAVRATMPPCLGGAERLGFVRAHGARGRAHAHDPRQGP